MKKLSFLSSLFLLLPFFASAQIFDKDLFFGIQNNTDVQKLQEFLTDQGYYSGPITGNFFSLTLSAVKKFQKAKGIVPVSGYMGPKTKAKMNELFAKQGISSEGVTTESGIVVPMQTSTPAPVSVLPITPLPAITPQADSGVLNNALSQILEIQKQLIALQATQIQQKSDAQQAEDELANLPAPTITSVSPNIASNGKTITFTIYGDNFQDGAKIYVGVKGSYDSTITDAGFQATVIVDGLPGTSIDVRIVNPDGKSDNLYQAIRIIN